MSAAADDTRAVRRVRVGLLMVCTGLVVHGSLYPWLFAAPASWSDAWRAMFVERLWWTGRGDALINLLLFLPIGASAWLASEHRSWRRAPRLAVVLVGSMALAFGLQVAQLWLPERTAAMSDALWNGVGTALGIPLAGPLRPGVDRCARIEWRAHAVPVALGLCWVATQGWPLMPAHSLWHIPSALMPLWRLPTWSPPVIAETALSLAVLLVFARELQRRQAFALALLLCALTTKLLVRQHVVTPSHLAGWVLGLGFAALAWRIPMRPGLWIAAALAAIWYLHGALTPFIWVEQPGPFHWLPLSGALQAARVAHTWALVWALFWVGVVMAALQSLGMRPATAAAAVAGVVLATEVVQRWLPGQQADITPVLFPLCWAWFWRRWNPTAGRLHL